VEVRKRLGNRKGKGKKRSASTNAQSAAQEEAANAASQELHSIQEAAENRAARMLVALDSLTMMHCATRQFSDPDLQQAVDESQTRLRQFLGGVASSYNPKFFLATTPLVQMAAGKNGLKRSLLGSNSLVHESEIAVGEKQGN
jgi:hypothetical protein